MLNRLAVGILAIVFAAPALAAPGAEPDFRSIVRVAKARVFPAVVYIRAVRSKTAEGRQASEQVSGSGVIVSPDGEVVTNWHVVDKATSLRCLLSDGRPLDAEIVGTDQDTDLAVIKLDVPEGSPPLPYAEFGPSAGIEEGDFVMAMGAPFGLNRSVSIGIVSCARRYLPDISEYSLWLQTDAAINPGNSGGPLVDTSGRVVGINSRGMDFAEDMGFAIPSDVVLVVVNQIREHGQVNWAWTGMRFQPLRDFDRNIYFGGEEGLIVAETERGSPARRAGIQPRDRVLAVNGDPLTAGTEEDLPEIRRRVALLPRDEPAIFTIERDDTRIDVEVTPREKGRVEGEELVCERWDLSIKTINQFDNPQLHFYRKAGVFVYGVDSPGNASSAGLLPNDIILEIDGSKVTTLEDVKTMHAAALEAIGKQHRLVFVVLRGGLMRHVVLDFSRDYSKR